MSSSDSDVSTIGHGAEVSAKLSQQSATEFEIDSMAASQDKANCSDSSNPDLELRCLGLSLMAD